MRHFVAVPQNDYSGPEWHGGTPVEQGYNVLPIPGLKRPDAKENEYYVYSNATEFKAIEADSAVSAIIASQIEDPHKVIHAHARIADVIETKKLEYTGKNNSYMLKRGFKGIEVPVVKQAMDVIPKEAMMPEASIDNIAIPNIADSNETNASIN